MEWTVHNNANHGTRYAPLDNKAVAVAFAQDRHDAKQGEIVINDQDRAVYFRANPSL